MARGGREDRTQEPNNLKSREILNLIFSLPKLGRRRKDIGGLLPREGSNAAVSLKGRYKFLFRDSYGYYLLLIEV